MKKIAFIILTAILLNANQALANSKPAIPKDSKIEKKVEKLLSKMTLDEKIGQMTELTIDVITDFGSPDDFKIKQEQLELIIGKYKVGSILNVPLSKAQTPQKWAETMKIIQDMSMKEIGIPCIYGLDQIHGATYTAGGTMFPQGINLAASFNKDLVREAAEITAYETRASCIPWTYAPTLDVGRDPRWPRLWESYGEDSHVNAVMGVEAIKGFQGNDPNNIGEYHIAACPKHYLGYGVPVSGKDRTPSSITDADMRERYFEPFREAIEAGALTIMVNSASNNGLPFHANKELLTDWLKEDLNWDGMIVTDWNDINNLYMRERVATSKKDAVRLAINAGIDMAMVPYETQFCDDLKELVNEGAVSMERIDDAVRRVLRLKYRLGLFDNPYWDINKYTKYGGEEHAKAALRSAEETEILLKNENNILPIKKGKKILVTGPNANTMRPLNGGWSYSWQGDKTDEFTEEFNTIFEAFANKYGKDNVVHQAGVTYKMDGEWWEENEPNISEAVKAAKDVDIIVACIGENSYCETPGNLTNLTLSSNQIQLVKELAETGKPILLVLNAGRPRLINDIEPLADGIVSILLPGNFGADALANLVAGDANFSAKLPYTYPRLINSLVTYDFKPSEQTREMEGNYNYDAQIDVQWEFGYGLSYTQYEYSNLKVDKKNFTANDWLTVTVDVKNIGDVAGKEPVLLYTTDIIASVSPDNIRLRAFDKVELQPKESKTVTFKLKGSDLAFVNQKGKWTIEEGEFLIKCGKETASINCTETKLWETPNR